jgi:hypothetical protein
MPLGWLARTPVPVRPDGDPQAGEPLAHVDQAAATAYLETADLGAHVQTPREAVSHPA